MIENRVRKLKIEEERLRRQIMIANKHSQLADEAKGHYEEKQKLKRELQERNQQRIEQ
jgi:hypothetical protein